MMVIRAEIDPPRTLDKSDLVFMRIPEQFWDASIEKIAEENQEFVRQWIKHHKAFMNKGFSINFSGPSGTGKTSMAVAMMKYGMRRGYTAYFTCIYTLVNDMIHKRTIDDELLVSDHIRRVPLLVLDDLFASDLRNPYFGDTQLFQLIRYRRSKLLPTIVTTTMNLVMGEKSSEDEIRYAVLLDQGVYSTVYTMKNKVPPPKSYNNILDNIKDLGIT